MVQTSCPFFKTSLRLLKMLPAVALAALIFLSLNETIASEKATEALSAAPKKIREIKLTPSIKAIEYQLANGLTVFLLPNRRAPVSSVYHWVQAGSLHESPGNTGMAHLFEHMMFRPLKKGDKGFFDLIREFGGEGNANTRYTATVYTTSVPNENLEKILEIESNRFKQLKVDDELLNVERKAVWSEYSTKIDNNPVLDLWHAVYHNGFKGHPFGWTIIGEREDLEKIKATACNEFFQKFYVPNNVGLFIAGDFNPEKMIDTVQKNYGDWKPGAKSTLPTAFQGSKGTIRAEGKLPSAVKNILFGYRIPLHDGKNHHLLALTTHILFGSQLSLADQRFVHTKKLASGVDDFNTDYDAGMMKGYINLLGTSSYDAAITQIPELLKDLEKLPKPDFKAYLREYQTNLQESVLRNEDLNSLAALSWGKWGSIDILAEIVNKPLKVSKEEILAFAKATMTPENLVIVTNKLDAGPAQKEGAP